MKKLIAVMLAGFVACGLVGCSKNAATGQSILTLLSKDDEVQMGMQAAPGFIKEYGGEVPSKDLQAYVSNIGTRLSRHAEGGYAEIPWKFTLLNTETVNAFALPGGQVFFTRGLASRLTNEAQMAGVIGHEIGHVTAQHGNQRVSQQVLLTGAVAVAGVVVGTSKDERVRDIGSIGVPALAVGGQLVMLSYGRKEELQSDALGVRYMSKEGYDPAGQMQVMQVLKSISGNRTADLFSTHPDPDLRIAKIQEMLGGEYSFTQNNPQYRLKETEYRSAFLSKLAMLPAAPDAAVIAQIYGEIGPPSVWCAHCRVEAEQVASSVTTSSLPPPHSLGEGEEDPLPVGERKGVYAFLRPAPR